MYAIWNGNHEPLATLGYVLECNLYLDAVTVPPVLTVSTHVAVSEPLHNAFASLFGLNPSGSVNMVCSVVFIVLAAVFFMMPDNTHILPNFCTRISFAAPLA